jgi:hypothetical protein
MSFFGCGLTFFDQNVLIKIRTLKWIKHSVEKNCWSSTLMRDLKKMRERYLRDETSVRMGNMASSLLRLSRWVQNRHKDEAIVDLMREIAWFMEWSGDLASPELTDMQREICRWRRVWPIEQARSILALPRASDVEPDLGMVRAS